MAQVGEAADGLRDGACKWTGEFLCRTGHTQIGSESSNVPDRALKSSWSSLRFVSRPSSGGIAPGRQGNMRGKFRDWLLFCVELHIHRLTLQLVPLQVEVRQLGQVADGLRDGACVRYRELLCRTASGAYTDHAPERELLKKLSTCRLVRLPMDAGMAPARGIMSFCVGTAHTRTHPPACFRQGTASPSW